MQSRVIDLRKIGKTIFLKPVSSGSVIRNWLDRPQISRLRANVGALASSVVSR